MKNFLIILAAITSVIFTVIGLHYFFSLYFDEFNTHVIVSILFLPVGIFEIIKITSYLKNK